MSLVGRAGDWRRAATISRAGFTGRSRSPAAHAPGEYPKLFVVGSPRSGTTWIKGMLAAHPATVSARESHVYDVVLETLREFGTGRRGWSAVLRAYDARPERRVAAWVDRPTFVRLIGRAMRSGLAADAAAAGVIRGVFDAFYGANGSHGQHLVEKTPGHVFHAREILDTFPEAKLIEVLRDGRDVCVSLERLDQDWAPQRRQAQIEVWTRSVEAGLAVRADPVYAGRVHLVRYEEVRRDPAAQLRDMYAFAGLEFDLAQVERTVQSRDASTLPERRAVDGSPSPHGVVGTWRDAFSAEDVELFATIAGDTFRRAGYAP